ncbi:MAG: Lrp/AsnC family transcriptional regulator [Promethearchaeota archaeon]
MKFDQIDILLLHLLGKDGRANLTQLGKQVGLSHSSVRDRLLKLEKADAVHIRGLINPNHFNLITAFILIESASEKGRIRILDTYSKCPRVIFVASVIGHYDIIALVYAEDRGLLEVLLSSCFLRKKLDIRQSSVMIIGTELEPPFLPINIPIKDIKSEISSCGLNCKECIKFQQQICIGCPVASIYRGSFNISP